MDRRDEIEKEVEANTSVESVLGYKALVGGEVVIPVDSVEDEEAEREEADEEDVRHPVELLLLPVIHVLPAFLPLPECRLSQSEPARERGVNFYY